MPEDGIQLTRKEKLLNDPEILRVVEGEIREGGRGGSEATAAVCRRSVETISRFLKTLSSSHMSKTSFPRFAPRPVLNSQLPPSSMKVRLTGGEPLLHPSLPSLLSSISQGYSPQSVGITTNAILLNRRWDDIKDHLTSVNISLDTLNNEKFKGLTRRDGLSKVIKGIERTEGWDGKVKLNCVVMKGFNAGAQDFKEFLDFQKEMGHR